MEKELYPTLLELRQYLTVVHHIPGRIRLKFNISIMQQLASFDMSTAKSAISNFPALKNYRLNLATSSVVIEYDHGLINPNLIDTLFAEDEPAFQAAVSELHNLAVTL
ncbi:HMA2 domain-containing protein [uncultured Photobacterium sp.]|uniref:HMA2 domain-containing protein n=1 Tax=uncultured Photobacterium sp. TaxID=173973 RepID=UPI002615C2B9|nr:cation transporter [uncultured Photobacterium sp.]